MAEDALVPRVREALSLIEPPATELELVAPLEHRVLVAELITLDVVELLDAGAAEPAGACDVEGAQARDHLPARNADGRVGATDAGPVGVLRLELHRVAEQKLVDRAAEMVRFQLNARPRSALFVPVNWLSSAARSGSEV